MCLVYAILALLFAFEKQKLNVHTISSSGSPGDGGTVFCWLSWVDNDFKILVILLATVYPRWQGGTYPGVSDGSLETILFNSSRTLGLGRISDE